MICAEDVWNEPMKKTIQIRKYRYFFIMLCYALCFLPVMGLGKITGTMLL
jgi:hypothetical protein